MAKVKLSSFLLSAAVLASAQSPTTYAPAHVPCPSDSLLRVFTPANQTLHPRETEYVDARLQDLPAAWNKWIDADALGYDLKSLGGDQGVNFPKVGIALSGGGYRAAFVGAGVLSALDSRYNQSTAAGTGGLLQVASYLSGLSGGSWTLSSLIFNSMPTMHELVLGSEDSDNAGWLAEADIFTPARADFPVAGINASAASSLDLSYYQAILAAVQSKAQAGFNVSLTDVSSAHGAGTLWSSIPDLASFQSRTLPYPIILADSRLATQPNLHGVPETNPVYEFTPFEMGSWDRNLSSFVNVKYIGTQFSGGKPVNASSCVTGFDQAGIVFRTSSSLFNGLINTTSGEVHGLGSSPTTATVFKTMLRLLSSMSKGVLDVANYPNPFRGIKPGQFQDSGAGELQLIDGGMDDEVIPLSPLMVKARAVDVIVAVDGGSDDSNRWPAGKSLYATSKRSVSITSEVDQAFPPLPSSQADFVKMGLSQCPTFLGCDPKSSPPEFPLVVYIPNMPPVTGADPLTNTDTLKVRYSTNHASLFLDAVRESATSGFVPNKLGADPNFGKCL
ncbi:hypothetical protein BOTBODRAFT_192001 [Botryobasidium botryosum FD-172 SS1]|uniref:Lysophospholipase n=1 Tax=Botryobasidium botryosum (strain FD-172 SS1) TaxID=930990 RepID=A0A067M033_BOTB1|nr:hypothetical protein BOTBODRAFT_192001 [Botryobasidium botryosum FD-172 SS1]